MGVVYRAHDEVLRRDVALKLITMEVAGDAVPAAWPGLSAREPRSRPVPDLSQRLQDALADRYRFERELGRGGMATVYLAEDLKHHRHVALKVLKPELAAVLGPERFLLEIELAARLTHPHVLPLHDSGNADGFLYYVMPYVEGESLRGRLTREKQLPLADALQIAREVADALSYAHNHGVVHRDIKPENILLGSGHAVVADFGIARAIDQAGGEKLTGTGITVGTPAYMSPEQAAGSRDLDGRSDLYSLGCVLYEMLAGVPPFAGTTAHSLAHQHQNVAPRPVTELRPAVPGRVAMAVQRALAKAPADRFSPVTLFAEALALGGSATEPEPPRPRPARWAWALLGLVLALLAVGFALYPAPIERLIKAMVDRGGEASQIRSLAVLPLRNLSGDAAQEFFADGMTEELITQLNPIDSLTVISPTSVKHYKDTKLKLPQIARELGVDGIVMGTVMRSENRVRITAHLFDGPRDQQLWAESYDRDLKDVIQLQREVARDITTKIQLRLSAAQSARLAARHEVDPEAYELYLRGRYQWNRRSAGGLRGAIDLFERAVRKDSLSAIGYCGLADAWAELGIQGHILPHYAHDRAKAAALRALELDNHLSEAHVSLAHIRENFEWDWKGAEEGYLEAISLNRNNANAHHYYSHNLARRGRLDRARAENDTARRLDPRSLPIALAAGTFRYYAGRYEEASELYRQAGAVDSSEGLYHRALAGAYDRRGMHDLAVVELRKSLVAQGQSVLSTAMGQAAAAGGADAALDVMRQALVRKRSGGTYVAPVRIAELSARLGHREEAFQWLEIAEKDGDPELNRLRMDPIFESLRSDPRYGDLLRRIRLSADGWPPPS